jgi:hypothetical protein
MAAAVCGHAGDDLTNRPNTCRHLPGAMAAAVCGHADNDRTNRPKRAETRRFAQKRSDSLQFAPIRSDSRRFAPIRAESVFRNTLRKRALSFSCRLGRRLSNLCVFDCQVAVLSAFAGEIRNPKSQIRNVVSPPSPAMTTFARANAYISPQRHRGHRELTEVKKERWAGGKIFLFFRANFPPARTAARAAM